MNLLFDDDIKNKEHFDIILLINAVTERRFGDFISAILSKKDWIEELCCSYFREKDGHSTYLLETFEDNNFYMDYDEFVEYVKLAVIRYLNNCTNEENKNRIKEMVEKSSISDLLDNLSNRDEKRVPLVYTSQNS